MRLYIEDNKDEELTTKTTKINGRYHNRLYKNGIVIDEVACSLKIDIGFCYRWMLRWHDKCGGLSKMASSSRIRNNKNKINIHPVGKIWYHVLELN